MSTQRSSARAGDDGVGSLAGSDVGVAAASSRAAYVAHPIARQALPIVPTPLIGREQELRLTRERILRDDVRLLTLTGAGGTGKTRLSLELAASLQDHFTHGSAFVDLTTARAPSLVLPNIGHSLGIREAGGRSIPDAMAGLLENGTFLLVLDNFEQVLPAATDIAELLQRIPGLKVLVTSREPLRLRWEHEFPLAPLSVPDEAATDPDRLATVPSVALFVYRAQTVQPTFALTTSNVAMVAELCRRLDGLPLAIELAAARLKVLPLPALLGRLEKRLDLLRATSRDIPGRHQTLREAIRWSYDLLSPREQSLYRRLAVFSGGATLEAIEAVCAGEDVIDDDLFDLIASLVDKSLLIAETGPDDAVRYSMLETLREYGLERLEDSEEAEATRAAHARYFTELAERSEPGLIGPEQATWFRLLDREWGNMQAAMAWSVGRGEPGAALRLGASLAFYSWRRGRVREGRRWLQPVLGRPEDDTPDAASGFRLKALLNAGFLAGLDGDIEASRALLDRGSALARALGDASSQVLSLGFASWVDWVHGRYERTVERAEQVEQLRAQSHPFALGFCLVGLGKLWHAQGRLAEAARCWEDALAVLRPMGEAPGVGLSLAGLAQLAAGRGDHLDAIQLARQSLLGLRGTADPQPLVNAGEAIVVLEAARPGAPKDTAAFERRARVIGAVDVLREVTGLPRAVSQWPDWERLTGTVRSTLGGECFDAEYGKGRELPLDDTIDELLDLLDSAPVAPAWQPVPPDPLSPREREIAALIARGYTSKQIAEALVISERTADAHADHIRTKLGLRSRAEIAAWATERGLRPPQGE